MGSYIKGVNDSFGGLILRPSGYVDIPTMLEGMTSHLQSLNALSLEEFDYTQVKISDGGSSIWGVIGR